MHANVTGAISKERKLVKDRLVTKGDFAFDKKMYALAAKYYQTYENVNNSKSNAIRLKLLDCYMLMHDHQKALDIFNELAESLDFTLTEEKRKINLADLLARFGQYSAASDLLKSVPGYEQRAEAFSPTQVAEMKKDSSIWQIEPLSINTPYREFAPCFVDGKLIFSSNRPLNEKRDANNWDGYNYSQLWRTELISADSLNESFSLSNVTTLSEKGKSKQLADIFELTDNRPLRGKRNIIGKIPEVNAAKCTNAEIVAGLNMLKYNVGVVSFDKAKRIYFSANTEKPDHNQAYQMHILEGVYDDGVYDVKELNFSNGLSTSSYMHPAIFDENILVCSSNVPGGKGGYDLYYATRKNRDDGWSELKPVKIDINTNGDEVYPAITSDGYLYFSSNGLPGLGGLDIYRVRLSAAIGRKAGSVEHLLYPINSDADDFGWAQDKKGNKIIITSDRGDGDNDNLYLVQKARKKGNPYLTGFVKDKMSAKPISGANVFLWVRNKGYVLVTKTDKDGKYQIPVRDNGSALLKATKSDLGADCQSLELTVKSDYTDTIQHADRDLLLGNIYRVGYTWRLDNIQYDFNKWNIRSDARPILDKVVKILNEFPITIELSSHTDSRGSDEYNMKLSEKRAQSAVDYIVSNGIDRSRLFAKGYGETRLLNSCGNGAICSETEHQINRRTEVKVLDYKAPAVEKTLYIDNIVSGMTLKRSDLPVDFFKNCNDTAAVISQREFKNQSEDVTQHVLKSGLSSTDHVQNEGLQHGLSYYVVLSSSMDKSSSDVLAKALVSNGYNAKVLSYPGRYRVVILCNSQSHAEEMRNSLMAKYKDAWILTQ
jgi:outer membrane protein OmpA-like peptidoglycan-associated protein